MSDTKPIPCPNPWCESKAEYVEERGIWFIVVCEYCGNRGPARKSREDAIAAWNTRPAPALTPKRAAADEMFEALENCAELLNVAMERLGVCGEGDSGQRRADAEFPGGVAALHAARAALAKAGQP